MSSQENAGAKICAACGKDAAGLPRVKDSRGRYFHKQCYEAVKRKLAARKAAQASQPIALGSPRAATSSQNAASPAAPRAPVAGRASGGRSAATSRPSPPPSDLTSELLEELPLLDSPAPPPAAVAAPACPACGQAMTSGAVMCVACGFNSKTGVIMATAAGAVPKAKPVKGGRRPGGSLLEPPWLFGAGPALVLLILFGIGLGGGGMATPFTGFYGLYSLAVVIWLLIKAFGESVLAGILCLCLPVYSIYFVYGVAEDSRLKYAYTASLLGGVLYVFLAMQMASEGSGPFALPGGG